MTSTSQRKTSKTTLLACLVFASCIFESPVMALDANYDFLQVHALQASYGDISGFDMQGVEVRAGLGWQQFFGELRYRNVSDRSGERKLEDERWNISLGYAIELTASTWVDIRVNYGSIELIGSSPTEYFRSAPKYEGISSYIFHSATEEIEIYGGLEWQNLPANADQKAYHLGARYNFDRVSLGTEYTKYSDSDAISVFVRYSF